MIEMKKRTEEIKQANKNTKNMVKLMEMANDGGRKQERREIKKKIENLWNLRLNNQEALAYFNGFEDTKKKLLEEIGE